MAKLEIPFKLPEIYLSKDEIDDIKYYYIKARLTEENNVLHAQVLVELAKYLDKVKIKPPKELIDYLEERTKKLQILVKKAISDLRKLGFSEL